MAKGDVKGAIRGTAVASGRQVMVEVPDAMGKGGTETYGMSQQGSASQWTHTFKNEAAARTAAQQFNAGQKITVN